MLRIGSSVQKAYADFLLLYQANELVGADSNYARFAAQLGVSPFINVAASWEFKTVLEAFNRDYSGPPRNTF